MDTKKIEKQGARLVAHRGLSGIEAENTNAAFVAAGNRSYYGIETDIWRTKDGKFAVSHDGNLKRVGGEDIFVELTDLEVLKDYILLDKDGKKIRSDLRVSTLEEYLDICKRYEKHSVLELKSHFTKEEIAKIIETVKEHYNLDSVTFISFCYGNLEKIRAVLPKQSVQFLFSDFSEEIIENLNRDRIDADVYHVALGENEIKELHAKGLKVNCWTVDDPQRAEELVRLGVDFITTNILE